MGKPHLSRHFLASRASCVASIPFAAAGQPDETGVATTHNVLAFTGWNDDAQVDDRFNMIETESMKNQNISDLFLITRPPPFSRLLFSFLFDRNIS